MRPSSTKTNGIVIQELNRLSALYWDEAEPERSLETAWLSLDLVRQGYRFPAGEGLVNASPEVTIQNFGYVAQGALAPGAY